MRFLGGLYSMKLFFRFKSFSTRANLLRMEYDYLFDENTLNEIENNIKIRKGIGDVKAVSKLYREFLQERDVGNSNEAEKLAKQFYLEMKKIPNKTHPDVISYGTEPKIIKYLNDKPIFSNDPYDFSQITRKLNIMRTDQLGLTTGNRSYYFMSDLAELEEALIKYTLKILLRKGFKLISVPDILPSHIIASCGMAVDGDRTQIYTLDSSHHGPDLCLSGTAEMALAGLLMNTKHKEKDLPLKLAAVSRCFRAETSNLIEQRGIYRVHQFTKVEMFSVTTPEQSEEMLENIRKIEEESFSNLGLHMRVLDMPPHELGAPAFRKYDIEAWMPGRNMFGEISSCSNCTDYQSQRLNIKYIKENSSEGIYAHTLNGTACAIPRMLIAILETHQTPDGKVLIPIPLRKYLSEKEYLTRKRKIPDLKIGKLK